MLINRFVRLVLVQQVPVMAIYQCF